MQCCLGECPLSDVQKASRVSCFWLFLGRGFRDSVGGRQPWEKQNDAEVSSFPRERKEDPSGNVDPLLEGLAASRVDGAQCNFLIRKDKAF